MFSSFNCMEVDGTYRLRTDIEIVCYEGSHKLMLVIVALPSIIIWCLGIPATALVILLKNRTMILKIEN